MRSQHKDRLVWIDLIRVTSAFLVIGSHATWQYEKSLPGTIPDSYWLYTHFIDNFARCAVPLFLMVSGYLILRKSNSLKHGYFQRLLKIGVPLLFWSIVYLVGRRFTVGVDLMGNPVNFNNGIRCILTGKVSIHLWFLYAIMSLYIAAPILHSYVKSASRENKIYFLLLWGCACFLFPILNDVLKISFEINNVNFTFYLISESVGFFVAGYFLGHIRVSARMCLICAASFVFLALIITWVGFVLTDSNFVSNHSENARALLAHRFRIPLALMAFVVLKYIGETQFFRQPKLSVGITRFASLTFGIYLVHILALLAIKHGVPWLPLNIFSFDPWFSYPLTVGAAFFSSALTVWLLKKVPLSHWVLP